MAISILVKKWDEILSTSSRFNHILRPFSALVKDTYGKYTKGLYLDAMDCYRDECAVTRVKDIIYPAVKLQVKDMRNDYFNMTYPVADDDGSIYAAVKTFDHTTAIYQFSNGGARKKMYSMGAQKDSYFDCAHGRFVWTEIRLDHRWIRKDRNVIVVAKKGSGHRKSILPEKGFFTPSLNPKGTQIVTLHEDRNGQYNLRILDAEKGKLIAELPNPENLYLGYPRFNETEDSIIATARNARGQMCLVEQDIRSGSFRYITHYSYAVIGRPMINGPWIFVATGLDQLDQVFAVDRHSGIFYQISDGNDSHYDPEWDPVNESVIAGEFRLNGKKLVRLPGDPYHWRVVNLTQDIKEINASGGKDLLAEPVADHPFVTRKYSAWSNAINPHSWIITANDPTWGVEVKSDNILNTVSMAAGYEYNRNTKAKGPYLDARFGMWFPEFEFRVSRISRDVHELDGNDFRAINDRFRLGMTIPLVSTPGIFQQQYVFSTFTMQV